MTKLNIRTGLIASTALALALMASNAAFAQNAGAQSPETTSPQVPPPPPPGSSGSTTQEVHNPDGSTDINLITTNADGTVSVDNLQHIGPPPPPTDPNGGQNGGGQNGGQNGSGQNGGQNGGGQNGGGQNAQNGGEKTDPPRLPWPPKKDDPPKEPPPKPKTGFVDPPKNPPPGPSDWERFKGYVGYVWSSIVGSDSKKDEPKPKDLKSAGLSLIEGDKSMTLNRTFVGKLPQAAKFDEPGSVTAHFSAALITREPAALHSVKTLAVETTRSEPVAAVSAGQRIALTAQTHPVLSSKTPLASKTAAIELPKVSVSKASVSVAKPSLAVSHPAPQPVQLKAAPTMPSMSVATRVGAVTIATRR